MIEMRWVIAPIGSGRGLIGGSGGQMHETVLQYRYLVCGADASGALSAVGADWSEWKDAAPPSTNAK